MTLNVEVTGLERDLPSLAAELHKIVAERLEDVRAIADFLEVSVEDLLGRHGIALTPVSPPALDVELAKSWDFNDPAHPRVGNRLVPWFLDERGPKVQQTNHPGLHILWLPVLIDQPLGQVDLDQPDGLALGTPVTTVEGGS